MLVTQYSSINYPDDALANWLMSDNIDSSKLIINTLTNGERQLVAACPVTTGESILTLPMSHLMSATLARKSPLGEQISKAGFNNHGDQSFLAVYILQERKNENSFWSLYLDALPTNFNHIPLFYSANELSLLQNNVVMEMALTRRFVLAQDYHQLSQIEAFKAHSLAEYMWARTAINTRCFFLNDDVVMAPFMDFINHVTQPNTVWGAGPDNKSLVLVCKENIAPGEEVTISYGNKSNRRFFNSYGFVREDESFSCARLTLSLDSGDPLVKQRMALLNINDTSLDVDIGSNEPDGFIKAMLFMRVSTAITLQTDLSFYSIPQSKSAEADSLKAFLWCCQQMLALYNHQPTINTERHNGQINGENQKNCEKIVAQEQQVLNRYILLASTALTLISHGNSLAFLQPDIESSYVEALVTLVTETQKGPL